MSEDDEDAAQTASHRFSREGGDRGLSLGERISEGLHRMSYRTVLHKFALKGRFPLKLLAVPHDPLPGDPVVGASVGAGRLTHAGYSKSIDGAWPRPADAPAAWHDWANGFSWLRDLAAADKARAAKVAEPIAAAWLALNAEFDERSWAPSVLGTRILFWTAYAPLILASGDMVHRSAVLNHLARGSRHLERSVDKATEGLPRIAAAAGLVASALLLPGGEPRQGKAEAVLGRALDGFLLPDGGLTSRSPLDQVELLELLLFLQSFYSARQQRVSEPLAQALARLVPGLKGALLGDGAMTAIHGSGPGDAGRIARDIEMSGVMARPTRNGAFSGVQRMQAGKTIVVLDAGPPPIARVSNSAHAGTLAFEMSDGAQRLVVNCGGARGNRRPVPAGLAEGLRTTAAHSTLVLADTNSTRVREDGTLGKGIEEVVAHRHESEEGIWVDAAHDGYVRRYGFEHQRRLYLSADGIDLRGEDALATPKAKGKSRKGAGLRFDIRFHLGAGVEATPTADGQGALLKAPGGAVWGFKARGGRLALEDSLWVDGDGHPHATQVLTVTGDATAEGASVNWSFKRAR